MPYWRKREDYNFPKDLPDYYWAWEFLRRNRDYRKDWNAALSRFPEGREATTLSAHSSFDPDSSDFYLPVAEKDKWSLTWGLVNPNTDRPKFLSLAISFGKVNLIPDVNQLPPGWVIDRSPIANVPEYLPAVIRFGNVNFFRAELVQQEPNGLRYPWAVFDLELPLKPQVARVLKILQDYQAVHMKDMHKVNPRRIKHHTDLWPHYLRLLDADLDGRTPKQIATALEEEEDGIDEKKVWDRLKAAKKLTKPRGYLDIVLSPPRTPK